MPGPEQSRPINQHARLNSGFDRGEPTGLTRQRTRLILGANWSLSPKATIFQAQALENSKPRHPLGLERTHNTVGDCPVFAPPTIRTMVGGAGYRGSRARLTHGRDWLFSEMVLG